MSAKKSATRAARAAEKAAKLGVNPVTVYRDQAAAMLGVDIQTIDGLITAKKLKASKIGRRVLIRVAALEAMLDANPAVQS